MFRWLMDESKMTPDGKKPKVWNIAVISVLTVAALVILLTRDPVHDLAVGAVVCVYLALTILFLLRAFVGQVRYNPYSYNTIYYPGFALFLLTVLIAQVRLMVLIRQADFDGSLGAMNLLSSLLGSAKTFMLFSSPFLFLFSLALCLSNLALIRHEGKRPVNLLGVLLSALLVGGVLLLLVWDRYAMGSIWQVMRHDLLVNLFSAFYLYFECMLIGAILVNLLVCRHDPAKDKDYVIILGCGLRKDGTPTPLLAGRVDRAVTFYRDQLRETGKAPLLIPSGGQGPDEAVSESAAMRDYLLACGIPAEHILMEDRSRTTAENMRFSKDLIQVRDPQGKTAFSTTKYHVFRSGLLARRVKLPAIGMGSKTKWYFWPNAAVREFVGLLTAHRLKQGLILGGMALLYCVSTVLMYVLAG